MSWSLLPHGVAAAAAGSEGCPLGGVAAFPSTNTGRFHWKVTGLSLGPRQQPVDRRYLPE